jgi:hypothetical protein
VDVNGATVVTLEAIVVPPGATMTPALPRTANPADSVFSWTPTEVGTYRVLFRATDTTGLQTYCQTILQVRGDSDGDGLPDVWEMNGYWYNNAFVNLPQMGAKPDHKDVFLEIDYMTGFRPHPNAIQTVVDSFARVPNGLFAIPNPDGRDGINLHVNLNTEIPLQATLGSTMLAGYDWRPFERVKAQNFQPALRLSSHYAVFGNRGPTVFGAASSGIARGTPSGDFLVTLGPWPSSIINGVAQGMGGTIEQQAGTLMHELGHTIGLAHGGPVSLATPAGQSNILYKPNYLSVMNYLFQFPGLMYNNNFGLFDYSRFELPTLLETGLSETTAVAPTLPAYGTAWYCGSTRMIAATLASGINWDCVGAIPSASTPADVNKDIPGQTLISYNDWANLIFTGGSIGAGTPLPDLVFTEEEELTDVAVRSIPPPAPNGLTARLVGSTVRLAWNPLGSLNSHSYRVFRKTGSGPYLPVSMTQSPALTQNLPLGAHTYKVSGISTFGVEGPTSQEVSVIVQ